ncbi:MAG: S-layer family protein [Phycisphaerales bacterium]|nr:MAG: S-layer family protein [Phycisphaerales bacterium]
MLSQQLHRTALLALGMPILMISVHARADVGPPVEIRMSLDEMRQAVSGEEYAGVFEVHVHRAGTLADFKLLGEGWRLLSLETPGDPVSVQPGVVRIPFRAVPAHADEPIGLSLAYNGRRVAKSAPVGPAHFARADQPRPAIRVEGSSAQVLTDGQPASEPEDPSGSPSGQPPGARSTLRVVGRIMYYRSDMVAVGADTIDVRVWDNDDVGHDVIWEGHTDSEGYFDTGVVEPESDPGGPDLVVYFETETANVVDVTDNSWQEWTYWWETPEVENFSGSFYDFGWITVPSGDMPALHIFNSIVRTRRFITTWSSYQPFKVQVEWPDDSAGGGAWFEYYTDMSEIHISTQHQWWEDTHAHEYGHHFMHVYSCPSCPPDPDYCWDPSCDPDPPDDCGHCLWCEETDHDAWNEGWPDWLADAVTRSLSWDYQFDDGTAYQPLLFVPQGLETPAVCFDSGVMEDPFETEGIVGALLRDIEDDTDLDGNSLNDDHNGDGIMDSLCRGPEPMLVIQAEYDPITVTEFINDFRTYAPEYADDLWPTAFNVAPQYVAGFPPDTAPPGTVPVCDSLTHPIGVGGSLPCITVSWQRADDDVTGVCDYSYQWGQNPAGAEPPMIAYAVDWNGCFLTATDGPFNLGDWYISIRAQDCDGNWSPAWSTFGPFEIIDCNGSGDLDLCDIRGCNASDVAGPSDCEVGQADCLPGSCETSQDCQPNYVPDECDLATGFSNDCNLNALPDECENMYHWDGPSGSWHTPDNWLEGTVPTGGSEVCIDVPGTPTVTYSNNALTVGTLACSESLNIAGGSVPYADLTLGEASWVDGDLGLSGTGTVLRVDDRLDIGGLFEWTGSGVSSSAKLTGSGVTYANGGVQISENVDLEDHYLILDGNSTSVCDGRVGFPGTSVFEIRPGSTYEHQGGTYFLSGSTGDSFVNGGTLIKSVNPGYSNIYVFTEKSGLIHVQTGALRFYLGGNSSGDFLGDLGTTFEFNGGHQFLPGSSIVADNVLFPQGGHTVRGTYDVTTATTNKATVLTFTSEADIISYGASFYILYGTVNFDAIVGGPIQFDTLSIGPGASGDGAANFSSGDPVQVTNLILGPGKIQGPGPITISGLTTWNAGGEFYGPGTINADGDVLVNPNGDQKVLRDCVFNNAGTATFLGGFNRPTPAVFNNLATGVVDIQFDGGAILGYAQPLNNAGTIVKSAGTGTSTIQAAAINTGTVEVQTGVLRFYTGYGGSCVQTAGQTVLNGGDLRIDPGSMQINGGLLTGAGTITGNVLNVGGTTAPGLSVGVIDIDGSYTQTTGGTLEIEIAGLTQTSEYDLLSVSGVASVAGGLDVIISTNGFAPAPGDSFQILTAGSVVGQFDTVNATNLSPYLSMGVIYTVTDVTLNMVGVVPGDCDLDGDADLDDYADMETCLLGPGGGIGPACACFDFDDNGDVDLGDFAEFQTVFTGP